MKLLKLGLCSLSIFVMSCSFVFAATCRVNIDGMKPYALYSVFEKGGRYFPEKKLSTKARSNKVNATDSFKKIFAFYLPFASHRDAGVFLLKQTDYWDSTEKSYPKNVRLWRNARKRKIFLGLFSRIDQQFTRYKLSDTVKYQVFHTLEKRIAPSGSLFDFHGSYVVNGKNRKTLSNDLKRRLAFAFEDLRFKGAKNLNIINLALANVKRAIPEIVSDAIAGIEKTEIISSKPIRQLTAKMYYFDGMKEKRGLTFCIPVEFTSDTKKTKLVIIDLDGENLQPIGKVLKWSIDWVIK